MTSRAPSRAVNGSGSLFASASTHIWWVLIAAVLGTALAYMSDDMLNLAAPSVARDLHATVTDVQWILESYYVALVSCVLIAGSIGDIVGHRRLFSAGLVVFSLGALVCASSPSVGIIIVGRAVQGIGAATLLTAGLALVTRLTPSAQRSRVIGQFLGLVAAVPALGPFASGALIDLFSWRWLFVLPLGLPLASLLVTRLVPETPRAAGRRPDVLGAAAAFVTLSAVSIGLIVGRSDATGIVPAAAFATAAIAATVFVLIERRASYPLLPLRFFRSRAFLGGNVVWLLGAMTSWGAVFFLAVALQTTLGLRPLVAGAILAPIYFVMMVGSPLAGRVVERVGPRLPILVGLAVYAAGLWMLSGISAASRVVPDVLLAIGVFGVGMATFSTPLAAVTLGSLEDADQGVASGVNNAMGQLAGLLAVAVLPTIAGLGGVAFDSVEFTAGYATALRATAAIAVIALAIAAATLHRQERATHEAATT